MSICKNCGHNGEMHSDGNHNHIGECYQNMGNGKLCDCKKFIYSEASE